MEPAEQKVVVREYYTSTLTSSADLKTSACCTLDAIPTHIRQVLADVPAEVTSKYYGCGSPLPRGIAGLRVLDLGSGSGRDCYVASKLVGEDGHVTGVDMTDAQLKVARKHVESYCVGALGYAKSNMTFVKGEIENLRGAGIEDETIDLAISNCVVNLSPDKMAVLRGVYRALANGGEFYFSDVYCDRRLGEAARKHPVLVGECLGGALYIEDFKRMCVAAGFIDPRVVSSRRIEVKDEALAAVLGEAAFYSITYRLFKLPPGRLESLCEDYGQYAVYKGTIPGAAHAYSLDDHHRLEKNKPFLVCGNTAAMLQETWLGKHFDVFGDRAVHYGLFDCSPSPATALNGTNNSNNAPTGACC